MKITALLALAFWAATASASAQSFEIASNSSILTSDLPDDPRPEQSTTPPPATTTQESTSAPSSKGAAAQSAAPEPAAETEADRRARAARELHTEEQQRMLGVIPNFNSVMSGEAEPLTAGQKFHLFFKASVDPFQFVAAGLDSALEQAQNEYPGYGQGWVGYAKRYGASFADSFDGNFWGNAILPAILHQDPRYFRLGHGSIRQRVWYAVISNVRCKGDNGKWQPSYSNILGNFIGGTISNLYYPAEDRGVGLTVERGFTTTAEGAIGSLAVEFYPDIIRHFRHRQKNPAALDLKRP